ncbi:MAG: NYN domain-containing protein [Chthoniobacteraceae bacterium]
MRYLLVDGHSVIFAWPELQRLHARRMVSARELLIRQLTEYQDATGVHVVAVFDGQGERYQEDSAPGGIQIFYSATGQSADAIIERLVAKYGKEHEITVVTNDLLEQQTVTTFGAVAVSVDSLRQMLEASGGELERRLKALRKK